MKLVTELCRRKIDSKIDSSVEVEGLPFVEILLTKQKKLDFFGHDQTTNTVTVAPLFFFSF